LQALEEQGLFVLHTPDGYRPLRALTPTRAHERGGRVKDVAPMHVKLLGWFLAEIDGQPIAFIRQRDRQIFKYLALQPNGCVSRSQLMEVFWPGVERFSASQSLRTVCSQIRKAIIHIVGFERVDEYFRAADELSIDLKNVIVDVACFLRHTDDGDELYDRGDLRGAYAHYCRVARVYRNDLLIGDAREAWVIAFDAALKRRRGTALARMTEIVAGFLPCDARRVAPGMIAAVS